MQTQRFGLVTLTIFFSVLAYQKINMISLLKKMKLCTNKIAECEVDS